MSANLAETTPAPQHFAALRTPRTLQTPVGEFLRTKGVSRVDKSDKWIHGFSVEIRVPGGKKERGFFADQKCGGAHKAFAAALARRDEILRAYNLPPTERYRLTGRPVMSNTGVVGVSRVEHQGHMDFSVQWRPVPRKLATVRFRVKIGEDEQTTFERAVRFRRARERDQWFHIDDGRALAQMIRQHTPDYLPADVREDVQQEIALAVLDGRVTPEELSDRKTIREYVRRGYQQRFNHRGFISTSAELSEGFRLEDVLEG